MLSKRAQVSTEYLLITGFILVVVTIIFTYSFVSNNQNIIVSQSNNALDKMANATDLVYALGPENTKFVEVVFPVGTALVQDITVCLDGFQGHNQDCSENGGVKLGGIEMQVGLIGGETSIRRPARAEVELDTPGFPQKEGFYRLKVYWCDFPASSKICLQKA